MRFPVEPEYVKKQTAVWLTQELPTNHGFGNKQPLPSGTKGYVVSNGFENARLTVLFPTYHFGDQKAEFNTFSAFQYLEFLYG